MAIDLITGAPGGGKTYSAVSKHMYQAIKDGRKVLTNLDLKMDAWVKEFGEDVEQLIEHRVFTPDPDTWRDGNWVGEDGFRPLIIIDESADILAKEFVKEPLLRFLRNHRREGYDIVLITQYLTAIDTGVRKLVEYFDVVSNKEGMGVKGVYTTHRYVMTDTGQKGSLEQTTPGRFKSHIYDLYDSRPMSDAKGKNRKRAGVRSMWLRPSLLFVYGALAICGYFIMKSPLIGFGSRESDGPVVLAPASSSGSPSEPSTVVRANSSLIGVAPDGLYIQVHDQVFFDREIDFDPVPGLCAVKIAETEYFCGQVIK